MPRYCFTTHNGSDHSVELDYPDDKSAREEARKAFAEAAHDALVDGEDYQMTMTVEARGKVIYRARFSFDAGDVN